MWDTGLVGGQILALGKTVLVSRSLPILPQVRCCIDTGPLLKHSLDHIQEKQPLVLALASVLEPLLHLLKEREGTFMERTAQVIPIHKGVTG